MVSGLQFHRPCCVPWAACSPAQDTSVSFHPHSRPVRLSRRPSPARSGGHCAGVCVPEVSFPFVFVFFRFVPLGIVYIMCLCSFLLLASLPGFLHAKTTLLLSCFPPGLGRRGPGEISASDGVHLRCPACREGVRRGLAAGADMHSHSAWLFSLGQAFRRPQQACTAAGCGRLWVAGTGSRVPGSIGDTVAWGGGSTGCNYTVHVSSDAQSHRTSK